MCELIFIPAHIPMFAVDFLRYSFGAMMANQFSGAPPSVNGWNPLAFYDLEGVNKWKWLGYQTIFFPGFVTMLWATLRWMQHMKR